MRSYPSIDGKFFLKKIGEYLPSILVAVLQGSSSRKYDLLYNQGALSRNKHKSRNYEHPWFSTEAIFTICLFPSCLITQTEQHLDQLSRYLTPRYKWPIGTDPADHALWQPLQPSCPWCNDITLSQEATYLCGLYHSENHFGQHRGHLLILPSLVCCRTNDRRPCLLSPIMRSLRI